MKTSSTLVFLPILASLAVSAGAITLDISSLAVADGQTGGLIGFDGDAPVSGGAGAFSFLNAKDSNGEDSGYSFEINQVADGVGDSLGMIGSISSSFDIGAVQTLGLSMFGAMEYAEVYGNGNLLTIFDGQDLLTANIAFDYVYVVSSTGGIETSGTFNLTDITYEGSVSDLSDLAAAGDATQAISFQFVPPVSLSSLTADGTTYRTSFSGILVATPPSGGLETPLPAAGWLFGFAVVGLYGIARFRKPNAYGRVVR